MNINKPISPLSAALAHFTLIMGKLRETIGLCAYPPLSMQGGPVPPLHPEIATLAWYRIQRAENNFRALAERFLAGRLRASKPALAPYQPPAAPRTRAPAPTTRILFPRRFAWLLRLTNGLPARHGLARTENLRQLLAEPAMQELLAASPRAGRILAASCRMLGIEKHLLTPQRPRSQENAANSTPIHTHPSQNTPQIAPPPQAAAHHTLAQPGAHPSAQPCAQDDPPLSGPPIGRLLEPG